MAASMLTLTLCSVGQEAAPIVVTVDAAALVSDVLAAAEQDRYTAKLLHEGSVLSPEATLDSVGITADATLTLFVLVAEELRCLTLSGFGFRSYKTLRENLHATEHAPLGMACMEGDIRWFYSNEAEALEAEASEVVQRVREAAENQVGRTYAVHTSIKPCLENEGGVADYHLDGLREATAEGALRALGASSEVESSVCKAILTFLAEADKLAASVDFKRSQELQRHAADLQLLILDAKNWDDIQGSIKNADIYPEALEKMEADEDSLRTLLNLISRGLITLHLDRFAETLALLGQVTGLEPFDIETE
eukprot:TRINITY_DN10467_c0_g1_i10.p1 TRINITY_DN10467_c0_g1~~TRINITY_DN10467_c0_g1_i10.p1  ORF type:complete len:308 (-),score=47.62 TRINITY_DN10467_c0_g1_i10:240-1163(-)